MNTKLFTIIIAFIASTSLWAQRFQSGDLYYRVSTQEGIMTTQPDTTGWNIPAECLTVAQAREICAKLESNATTGIKYYVKGWVKKLGSKHASAVADFGNALFYMEDVKDANSQEDFYAYQVYGLNGVKITHPQAVEVGDYVVVYGELTNYNGTYETVGKGAAYIWKSTNPNVDAGGDTGTIPGDVTGAGTLENPFTAADVLALNNTKSGNYWVKAYIVGQVNGPSISYAEFNAPFTPSTNQTTGALNTDNTNLLIAMSADVADATQCVAVQLPTGALRSGLNLPENPNMDGQEILLYGSLEKYYGIAGIKSLTYAQVGDKEFGSNPDSSGNNNGNDTGQGTFDSPFTAADVLALNNTKSGNYWVKAYIVGQVNGASLDYAEFNAPFTSNTNQTTGALTGYNTNILIAMSADETNSANCVPVQLPSGALRSGLNLVQNPEMDGQEILIYGLLAKYFSAAGIKSPSYAKVGDKEFGTKPNENENGNSNNVLLNETLLTQESFNKFTAVNVLGEQVWTYDAKYGAKISGYANSATVPNEDWFITPAIDLSGKSSATITFDHAFGPAYAMPDTEAKKAQYTIWVSNDFNGDVKSATWTELKGMAYGTDAWAYISSGEVAIPAANLKANCRIAWKYVCQYESATWEIKNIMVKGYGSSSNIISKNHNENSSYVVVTYKDLINNYSDITDVTIPEYVEHDGVTYNVIGISFDAFSNSNSIQTITIPQNIQNIGSHAFGNTPNLHTINFESSIPPQIIETTFSGMHSINLYVPCGSTEIYSSTYNRTVREYPSKYDIQLDVVGPGTAFINKNTICGAMITASPDPGYYFAGWNDGNMDNPRVLELTQDTILSAIFAIITSGQCGENLFWNLNDTKLSISGTGEMYDYNSNNQPWILFMNSIKSIEIENGATSIGKNAFTICTKINTLTLPSTIENIGVNAFANSRSLYDIYCYASLPPTMDKSSFINYNAYLYVPCESQRYYQADMIWGEFKNIQCISSDNVETDGVIITPTSNDVTIIWPTESNADTYTIVIKKGNDVFCTLTFNADGQLLNIAFAPSRNGNNHHAQYAEQTTNGYRFTVTGLEEGTHYTYNIDVKDAANKTIKSHSGEFITDSMTGVDNITNDKNIKKFLNKGYLLIRHNGKTYNVMGVEIGE